MKSKKDTIENILGLMRDLGITIEDLRLYQESEPEEDGKGFVCECGSPDDDDTFGCMRVSKDFFKRHKDPLGLGSSTEVSGDVVDDDFGGNE